MSEGSKQPPWIMVSLGTLALGLLFVGITQQQKESASNVANLPAVIARIDNLEASLNSEVAGINAQINRRELEMRDYVELLDSKKVERLEDIIKRVQRIENELYNIAKDDG